MTSATERSESDRSESGEADASTEPAGRRRRARWLVVVGFIAVIGATELASRLLATQLLDPDLPARIAFHDDQMDDLPATDPDAMLLVIGSSSPGAGIDPARLIEQSERIELAYNFWTAGPSMQSLVLHNRTVVDHALDPGVVVVGITPRELNDNGAPQNQGYESLLTERAYREELDQLNTLEKIENRLRPFSTVLEYRRTLTSPTRLRDELSGGADIDSTGPLGMLTDRRDRPEPLLTERHLEQEREALAGFSVGGAQLDALRELIIHYQERGDRVLVVNVPVMDVFIDLMPDGQADYDEYETAITGLVAELGVDYLDAQTEREWADDEFGDENHLNGAGAARLTDLVAAAVDTLP